MFVMLWPPSFFVCVVVWGVKFLLGMTAAYLSWYAEQSPVSFAVYFRDSSQWCCGQ